MSQQPSIGRIVHYQHHDIPTGIPRPAIITDAYERDVEVLGEDPRPTQFVDLCVFNLSGMTFVQRVLYSEALASGCWSWPPRT